MIDLSAEGNWNPQARRRDAVHDSDPSPEIQRRIKAVIPAARCRIRRPARCFSQPMCVKAWTERPASSALCAERVTHTSRAAA